MRRKKLIIFLNVPYDKFFRKKYLINKAKKYFDIKFYNIGNFYEKNKLKNQKNLFIIKNFQDLKKSLKAYRPEIGLMFKDDNNHLKIGKICKDSFNMKLAYMNIGLCPEIYSNFNLKLFFRIIFSRLFFFYIYEIINRLKSRFLKFFSNRNQKISFKFDFAIIAGRAGRKIPTVINSKKIIETCSYDLQKSYKFKVRRKNYAVFLDEDLYSHRDYKLQKREKKFVSKLYFDEINNFFKYFEKKFKIKIIICLHPRVNKIELCKKYFNNRKCLIDKSHHLVSNCRYVFLHPSTTALNLPIIYKKSAIFLISNELLKQLEWKARIDRRKSILNQHFINISHFEDYNYPKNFNTLHEEGYKKYMREFISSEKNNFQRNIWGDFHRYAN